VGPGPENGAISQALRRDHHGKLAKMDVIPITKKMMKMQTVLRALLLTPLHTAPAAVWQNHAHEGTAEAGFTRVF